MKQGIVILGLSLLVVLAGCEKDETLTEMARQTTAEQARQNERAAQQTQQIAEASKHLVAADSDSRRELISAQRDLQGDVSQERRVVDERLDALESERRRIALERQQAPVVAQALLTIGVIVASLLPLSVAVYLVRYLATSHEPGVELGNLLAEDLVSDKPLWHGSPRVDE
jgi:hypothetical protein